MQGERPPGMPRTVAPQVSAGGGLAFVWVDVPNAEQRAARLVIRVVAIDRAGNESPPVDVPVAVPGG